MKNWKDLKSEAFEKGVITPSILSADFSKLADEIHEVEKNGIHWLHCDVMDGHFVPNLTIGPVVIESLRKKTKSLIDCHLMVSDPEKWIEPFFKAGANCITIHQESTPHLHRVIHEIKSRKMLAGISITPSTPVSVLKEVLNNVDLILIMSVNPGFGGQSFIPETLEKVRELVSMRTEKNDFLIQIDGGIHSGTIANARTAGVDVFVAGSAIFNENDRKKAIDALKKELSKANGEHE